MRIYTASISCPLPAKQFTIIIIMLRLPVESNATVFRHIESYLRSKTSWKTNQLV